MAEESTVCSAREVLEEFNRSSVRVAWPRLADLLDVPPQIQHRISQRRHEYKVDPALLEEESLRQVLSYCENNDPNLTWETLSLALMSDRIYKELGASLYFKHVKPEEFTLDKAYEEVKEITNPHEIAYVLIQDSKKLREIWGGYGDELTPEERTKLAINHWMTSHPEASWMLLAKLIERYIHGEHEAAAQRIATTIREKYLPKVEEPIGPSKDSEKRKFPETFSANEAFQQLTAVEDWFGLGYFLEMEEEQLKQIEEEHRRDDDRKLAMLKLWVELNPKSASWNSLATAVRKMPQHQSLAEDIQENFLEQGVTKRRRIIQSESEEHSRELYKQFFYPLFESLCNKQVYSSLVDQLVSISLISEADKQVLFSSTQHPKVRAISLLEVLNIEEKPHLLMELIKAMEEVEELKGLADEMLTRHKANEVTKASRPTMNDLVSMQKRDGSKGKLKIIQWITAHELAQCDDFAHKLLVGALPVKQLSTKHKESKDEFIRAVLQKWLVRDDDDENEESLPCTWEALVKCCEDANLDGVFIKELRDNIPK